MKTANRKAVSTGVRVGRVIRGLLKIRKTRKVMPFSAFNSLVKKLAA